MYNFWHSKILRQCDKWQKNYENGIALSTQLNAVFACNILLPFPVELNAQTYIYSLCFTLPPRYVYQQQIYKPHSRTRDARSLCSFYLKRNEYTHARKTRCQWAILRRTENEFPKWAFKFVSRDQSGGAPRSLPAELPSGPACAAIDWNFAGRNSAPIFILIRLSWYRCFSNEPIHNLFVETFLILWEW